MHRNNFFKLIIAIAVSETAGVVGAFFTTPAIQSGWYAGIVKPALSPPSWVFGPVWTILFAMMGIAAFLVYAKDEKAVFSEVERWQLKRKKKVALGMFGLQLFLNALWSIIFFGLKNPGGAFIEIIFLWLAILATILAFSKISKPAVWLFVPYILWVSFAGYLNYSIWNLNGNGPEQIACTQEAKLCSDGSYVGRTGPKCEFAPCPSEVLCEGGACPGEGSNDFWKTTTDNKTGAIFQYPDHLLTDYIHTVDWPPQVQVLSEAFTCTEGGFEIARAGETLKRMVGDHTYCVTKVSEGAAGSIYTQYAYAFPMDSTSSPQADAKTVIFTFSLQAVQCGNYDDPQKTVCEGERETFDLDSVIDRMAKSIVLK